jgi:hypothetical protein
MRARNAVRGAPSSELADLDVLGGTVSEQIQGAETHLEQDCPR